MSPYRPAQRCNEPRCSGIAEVNGRCAEHRVSGWTASPRLEDRRSTSERLGITEGEWRALWVTTMGVHAAVCHVCGRGEADQVDHVIAVGLGGAKTDPENLRPIHEEPCHREKSARELVMMKMIRRRLRGVSGS